jgi:hypothetical protein
MSTVVEIIYKYKSVIMIIQRRKLTRELEKEKERVSLYYTLLIYYTDYK